MKIPEYGKTRGGICSALSHGKYQHKAGEQKEKAEVESGKFADIPSGLAGIVADVFPECDQAGKGCNEGSHTADVDTEEKIRVILCKLGEKNGGRNIADELAGQDADKKRALVKQYGKEIPDDVDPCHIAGENKEKYKSEKEGVVHHFQRLAVKKEQCRRDHNKTDPVRNAAENNGNRQSEKQKINGGACRGEFDFFIRDFQRLCFDEETADCDQGDGDEKGRRHDLHEFQIRDVEFGVQIQVLGVAERCQHAAEVGGNVLHDKGERHVFLLAGGFQNKKSQRQEGQQRHVVGDEHGSDEGDVHQRQNAQPGVFEALDDFPRQHIEKIDVLQRTDHGENAEQTGQCLEIKIAEIGLIRRDDQTCRQRREKGNHHNGVLFDKCFDRVHTVPPENFSI